MLINVEYSKLISLMLIEIIPKASYKSYAKIFAYDLYVDLFFLFVIVALFWVLGS